MNKVFVDVGGFDGDAVLAALDPRFGFATLHCFEPVPACHARIVSRIQDSRLKVMNAGLLDRRARLPIYFGGTLAGSVFADAQPTLNEVSELADFERASDFFREQIRDTDRVWLKLNCEGAEVAILEDLIASGEARKLEEVLLDLDAVKIPSARAGVDHLLRRLATVDFSFHFPEEIQCGMVTCYGGIHHWLRKTVPSERSLRALTGSLRYQLERVLDPRCSGYYKIRLLRRLHLREPAPLHPSAFRDRIRALRE